MILNFFLYFLVVSLIYCHDNPNVVGAGAGNNGGSVVEKFFERCWKDSDFLKMFTEPSCHLSWLGHLKTSPILAIDYVSPSKLILIFDIWISLSTSFVCFLRCLFQNQFKISSNKTKRKVGNGHDGSFRVIFNDGSKGLFKGCESEKFHFSWKAG